MSHNLGPTQSSGGGGFRGKTLFGPSLNKYQRSINRTKMSVSIPNQDSQSYLGSLSSMPDNNNPLLQGQPLQASQDKVLQQGLKTIVDNQMRAAAATEKIEQQKTENGKEEFTITHFENQENVGTTSEISKMKVAQENDTKEEVAKEAPKPKKPEPFVQQYRKHNHEVQLDYTLLRSEERNGQTPLIAVHGLLDSKASFSKVLGDEEILKKRDCYLVGIRNHANSDWHDDVDYVAKSDDIIRFADKMGIDKFTILGHSMGGRISMHTACRYPDRVEGIISLDSTPFHWNKLCYVFTVPPWRYLARMKWLEAKGFSKQEATDHVKEVFKNETSLAAMFIKLMDRKSKDQVKWTINVKAYNDWWKMKPTAFNDSLRYNKDTVYHLRGGYRQFNSFMPVFYTKVFPNFDHKNFLNDINDAGHFIHLEQPEQAKEYIIKYLDDMDYKIAKRNEEAKRAFSTTKAVQVASLPAWAQQ